MYVQPANILSPQSHLRHWAQVNSRLASDREDHMSESVPNRPAQPVTMTRKPQRTDAAVAIIRDTIAEYKSQRGVLRSSLSKQQRREIGEAKVSYTRGNLDEKDLQRTVEHVLRGAAA